MLQEELTWYRIDWAGPVTTDSTDQVHIRLCQNPLPQYILQQYIGIHALDVMDSEQMYMATHLFVESFAE